MKTGGAIFVVLALMVAVTTGCGPGTNTPAVVPGGLAISQATLPAATSGSLYAATITATGGAGGYQWGIVTGALPDGLAWSSNGGIVMISGTISQTAVSTSFTFEVVDLLLARASAQFSISVTPQGGPATLVLTSATQYDLVPSAAFSIPQSVSGGTAPYTWAISPPSGTLPPVTWVSIDPLSGELTGTAPAFSGVGPDTYTVEVSVVDSSTPVASELKTIITLNVGGQVIVIGPNPVTLMNTVLADAYEGVLYSHQFSAAFGTPPYLSYALLGLKPNGLTLNTVSGTLSGAPASGTAGNYLFTVSVTDSAGSVASDLIALNVHQIQPLNIGARLADGFLNTSYSATLSATGGLAPYSWAAASASVPAGLTVAPDGTVSGTPTAGGNHSLSVTVTDSAGGRLTASVSLTVLSGTPTLAIDSYLPEGGCAANYEWQLFVSGGVAPYSFAMSDRQTLPAKFELSSLGLLTAQLVPADAGTYDFKARVIDQAGAWGIQDFTIELIDNPTTIQAVNITLPPAFVNVPYSFKPTVAGPLDHYTWELLSGTLPAGLSFFGNDRNNTAGIWMPEFFGTPLAAGPRDLTLRIRGAFNALTYIDQTFTLNVSAGGKPFHMVNRGPLVAGYAGQPYGEALHAGGGSGSALDWTIVTGNLPAGLSIDSATGEINGTLALNAVASTFTVRATELGGGAASADFVATIDVLAAPASGTALLITDSTWHDHYYDGISAAAASVGDVFAMACDAAGDLYICETRYSSRIRKIDHRTQLISSVIGTRFYGPPTAGMAAQGMPCDMPAAIAVDASGAIYFGPCLGSQCWMIDTSGRVQDFGTVPSGGLGAIQSIVFNPTKTHAYFLNNLHNVGIWAYDLRNGTYEHLNNVPVAPFDLLWGLGINAQGDLYVSMVHATSRSEVVRVAVDPATGLVSKKDTHVSVVPHTDGTHPTSDILFDAQGRMCYMSGSHGGVVAVDGSGVTLLAGIPGWSVGDKRGIARDPSTGTIYAASHAGIYKVIQ